MKNFIKEFKEFALKGSMIDLAVAFIIGAALKVIIKSIVDDLIMPLASAVFKLPDFTNLYIVLDGQVAPGTPLAEARKVAGANIFAYGNFINIFVNFLLLAFAIFLMIKGINKLKRKKAEEPAPEPEPTATEKLLTEIRDSLKK